MIFVKVEPWDIELFQAGSLVDRRPQAYDVPSGTACCGDMDGHITFAVETTGIAGKSVIVCHGVDIV